MILMYDAGAYVVAGAGLGNEDGFAAMAADTIAQPTKRFDGDV